jgi:Na+-translocating ferredoxin:NAD+ oxidoreductase RnfA subunit
MWGLAWFWWLIIVAVWVMFIYFTFALAASKGRSPFLWIILAIFLPLITVILLLILPPRPGTQRV